MNAQDAPTRCARYRSKADAAVVAPPHRTWHGRAHEAPISAGIRGVGSGGTRARLPRQCGRRIDEVFDRWRARRPCSIHGEKKFHGRFDTSVCSRVMRVRHGMRRERSAGQLCARRLNTVTLSTFDDRVAECDLRMLAFVIQRSGRVDEATRAVNRSAARRSPSPHHDGARSRSRWSRGRRAPPQDCRKQPGRHQSATAG